jgi:hypothetical protein
MEVKIVKASKDSYWYKNYIGEIFEVTGVQDDIYEVRKWIKFPLKYDIAPVLKEDCEEIYVKNHVETINSHDWRMKKYNLEHWSKIVERSRFNIDREVKYYERLNKQTEIKIYKIDE